jgi:uncharacterized integral membrane protein
MRTLYGILVALVTLAVVIFLVQNMSNTTVTFLQMNATLPLGVVVLGAYLLGMSTGGFMAGLVRQWIARMNADKT